MYSKDINAFCQINVNMPDPETAGFGRFSGPDNRYFYTGNAINSNVKEAMVLINTDKGFGYNFNAMLTAEPVKDFKAMVAYTHTVVKEISGNPGSVAVSAWNTQASVNGPNQLGLQNSQYVTPDKLIGTISYRKEYAKNFATSVGLYYTGYNAGRFSYVYSNDMNQDGVNNDLIYIPATQDEILFIDANGFSATKQAEAFWKFINQDPYLSKHKGKYAEAYSASFPWVNRFDLKIAQDFKIKTGNSMNTLQLNLDVMNIGNLINNSWGVTQTNAVSNDGKVLKYEGVSINNVPFYSLFTNTVNDQKVLVDKSFNTYKNTSNCWQLQLCLRYFFN
jgi:hypothetical protein